MTEYVEQEWSANLLSRSDMAAACLLPDSVRVQVTSS